MADEVTQSQASSKGNTRSGFHETLRKVRNEKTGLLPFGVVVVACAIVVIPLYNILGLPGLYLSNLFLTMDCANNSWVCGAWLAILAASGPIVIGVLLLVFRTHVRKLLAKTKLPLAADFLVLPVLATIFFTMGWAGIAFHFFDRQGLVLDGYFPIVFGALIFALGRWGGSIKENAKGLFAPREKIPAKFRVLALFGTILLLGWILGPVHAPQRDQIVALLALLLGWWLFTAVPLGAAASKPKIAPTTVWAWLPLAILGILATIAERVLAQPCNHSTALDFFDCEQAHHNGTAAGASGAVGVIAGGTSTLICTDGGKSTRFEEEAHDAVRRGLNDEQRRAEREARDRQERWDAIGKEHAAKSPEQRAKEEAERRQAQWDFEDRMERERDEEQLELETLLIFSGAGQGNIKPSTEGPISREEAIRRLIERGELPPRAPDPDDATVTEKAARFIQGLPYDWTIQKGLDQTKKAIDWGINKSQQMADYNQLQKQSGGILPSAGEAGNLLKPVTAKTDTPEPRIETEEEIRKRLQDEFNAGKKG